MAWQVQTSHAAGVEAMGEAALDLLTTLPQQSLAALAADPPPVRVGRFSTFGFTLPVPATPIRLVPVVVRALALLPRPHSAAVFHAGDDTEGS